MSFRVFVDNLDESTTSEDVQEFAGQVGSVVDVRLGAESLNGRRRAFAFVEFADELEAELATTRLDGCELHGRRLIVQHANERPERLRGGVRFDVNGRGSDD